MENEGRTKNFRDEDMVTRRAFLRSYPLRWEEEEEEEDEGEGGGEEEAGERHGETGEVSRKKKMKKTCSKVKSAMKSNLISVLQWGEGKLPLLRKMKDKVGFYLVACHPFGFKTSTKFLTMD